MGSNSVAILFGIIVALMFSFFFSGIEMAFISLRKILLRKKATRSDHDLQRVQKIMRRPARFVSMVLIGNNIANVAASSLSTMLAWKLFPDLSAIAIEFLVLAILTPVIVFFCEVIPKNIGVLYAEKIAYRVNSIILFLMLMFRPLIMILGGISDAILWLMRSYRKHKKVFVTRQELRAIVDESVHKGVFSTREKQLIDTVFDFEHKTVRDKMRAISSVKKIDINDSFARVKMIASTSVRTRFLVHDKKTGEILGYVNVLEMLFEGQEGGAIKDFLRTPVFMPETIMLRDAFETLRQRREWLLFAVGPADKVSGILALNDILNF